MERVLITGGSRGIGAAAVRLFAAQGSSVSFCHTPASAGQAAALAAETGARAFCADVSDQEQVASMAREVGDVDILVCNAGISHYGLISDITPDQWDRLFAVNVKGMYLCVRAVLPFMLQKQSGSIVTVASMWGQVGASCEAAYSASKGAVIALTKALAMELGPSGIRVNCVAPGVIDTDMMAAFSAEDRAALCEETPLGRIGKPEEAAEAIAWAARAPFYTGQVLAVNGGFVVT